MPLDPRPGYVRMTHSALPGAEEYATQQAYRTAWYDEGWRSADDPSFTGTIPAVTADPMARVRTVMDRARSGGVNTLIPMVGDSHTEGFGASKRGLRSTEHLVRKLNGRTGIGVRYVPAATNIGSDTNTPASWPGGQQPWVYNGAVTGRIDFGGDLHAVNIPSGGYIELTYFGDSVVVVYVRTPTGPTAAAITIDGQAVGTINANGTLLGGQVAGFSPVAGDGYGFHTLRINATAAAFTVEGAMVHDGTRLGLGVPNETIGVLCFGHGGFATNFFAAAPTWARSVARLCCSTVVGTDIPLVIIALGANEGIHGIPPATSQANLITMMSQMDTEVLATGVTVMPSYLLVIMPTVTSAFKEAAVMAATTVGLDRCAVLDLREDLPGGGVDWGIFNNGGHANDAGQLWIADRLLEFIDPMATGDLPTVPPGGHSIAAADPATHRLNWAENFAVTAGQTYDAAGAPDTTVRERRHRIWLEPGTYQSRIRYEQRTANGGTLEVLIGGTTCGTQATAGTDGTIAEAALGTQVTIDSPGSYPVTIRKTSANGTVRFVGLRLRKTA